MAEGKPIIFITPLSENLMKLKDTINSDEAYAIYEVDSAADYAQMAPAIGASLTISSDIKKLAKILSENKKLIKKFNCKVLLLHDTKLPLAVTQKLEKMGLNEVLYEPIVPKTLLYKVSLLTKSLKNPIVKDTSDVVLKSKTENKPEVETKVDKDLLSSQLADKKLANDKLTAPVDSKIEFENLTQKADSKVEAEKNLSVKNDSSQIETKINQDLSFEEPLDEDLSQKSSEAETAPQNEPSKKKKNTFDLNEEKSASKLGLFDEEPSLEPQLKKNLNLSNTKEDIKPKEKNIPEMKLDKERKLKEKLAELPEEDEDRKNSEASVAILEEIRKKKLELPEAAPQDEKTKRAKEQSADPQTVEKTPQQKLEEKREKLRKLKQMAEELKTENKEIEKAEAPAGFDEMSELRDLDEQDKEAAAKASREKRIKELEELSRKKLASAVTPPEAEEHDKEALTPEQVSDQKNVRKKPVDGIAEVAKKPKKAELNLFDDIFEPKKDFKLDLFDDENTEAEEQSNPDGDAHERKRDHNLELADDDPKAEDEKSNLNEDGSERDKDYDLELEDDSDSKKKKHRTEETLSAEGFKVKKPELDENWDYDNIGKQEDQVIEQGESETINYSEFKEYQESSAYSPSSMKKKRKVYGEKVGDTDSTLESELESEESAEGGSFEEGFADKAETAFEKSPDSIIKAEESLTQEEQIYSKDSTEEFQKKERNQAAEEILAKIGKEYIPDNIEEFKKKTASAQLDEIIKKKGKEFVAEKAEDYKKKQGTNQQEEALYDKNKMSNFEKTEAEKLRMAATNYDDTKSEKTKTAQFYAPDEEKTKTKSFYKDDQPENVIRYGKKGEIIIPLDHKVATVTDEEIIIEKPYVHHDTKGLEYIAGVRTLHYWDIFTELRILEFVANKMMISKNAITTFYFRDPKSNFFEMVYSGHQECLEIEMYTDASWDQFERANLAQWEKANLPTWKDPTFTQDKNFFIFPFYEQQEQLGFAIISTIGQIKSAEDARILENILSSSRCYFLLRYHQALGIELVEKIVEEMVADNVVSINIFDKVKSFVKGIWGFMKKAA